MKFMNNFYFCRSVITLDRNPRERILTFTSSLIMASLSPDFATSTLVTRAYSTQVAKHQFRFYDGNILAGSIDPSTCTISSSLKRTT